jgi:hypothetical protein
MEMPIYMHKIHLAVLLDIFSDDNRIRGVLSCILIMLGALIHLIVRSEHHALPLQQSFAAGWIVRSQNLPCVTCEEKKKKLKN